MTFPAQVMTPETNIFLSGPLGDTELGISGPQFPFDIFSTSRIRIFEKNIIEVIYESVQCYKLCNTKFISVIDYDQC